MVSVSIVAALGNNRVLGKGNELLWHISDDLKRFKELTMGHPVIMGRKTFDSIVAYLGKPLPGRTNIVVTRNIDFVSRYSDLIIARSVEEAIEKGKELDSEVYVIGGAQIYEAALPYTDKLYLTLIDDEKEGDVFFPDYAQLFTKVVSDEARESQGLHYRWVDLEKN